MDIKLPVFTGQVDGQLLLRHSSHCPPACSS